MKSILNYINEKNIITTLNIPWFYYDNKFMELSDDTKNELKLYIRNNNPENIKVKKWFYNLDLLSQKYLYNTINYVRQHAGYSGDIKMCEKWCEFITNDNKINKNIFDI